MRGLKSENKDNNNNLYRNGLFGAIYNATVQNLGIENADIVIPMNDTSTYGKGILVDWMTYSTIKNCYTTGSITGGSYIEKFIGGIAGFLNGNNSISQCYSTAAITGNYDGEYYAEQEGGLEPMDCWDSLGGIVGASYSGQVTISDCWFGGENRCKLHSGSRWRYYWLWPRCEHGQLSCRYEGNRQRRLGKHLLVGVCRKYRCKELFLAC